MSTDTMQGMDLKYHIIDEVLPYEDSNDPDRRTHIVSPPENVHIWQPGMEAQDVVDVARATGQEVTALCGYKFVPKHNPDKFDACDTCMKIAAEIWSS